MSPTCRLTASPIRRRSPKAGDCRRKVRSDRFSYSLQPTAYSLQPIAYSLFGDSTECNGLGSGGDFQFDDQVEQVLANILLTNLLGAFLAEVRQLPHRPQVSVNRSFRFPGQSQVIDHFLEEISFEKL